MGRSFMPFCLIALTAVSVAAALPSENGIGTIEARAPGFARIVPTGSKVHRLAHGFTWAEGPVWLRPGRYLLLSDVSRNRIYRWSTAGGVSVFLDPSGGTATTGFREPGSNGLKVAAGNLLLIADQGNRAIALLDLKTKAKRILADRFEGKRLNSPNDLAVGPDGAIWFTDPPYGLEGIDSSPLKEQAANRVYRRSPDGRLTAIESGLDFPNGIAFSPDGRTLYVSNSDPKHAVILAWNISAKGKASNRHIFADMTDLAAKGLPGLPDGMTVDQRGNIWATGPGGIHVLSPHGKELGLISTGAAISNCTFGGADGRTLFMTSTHDLVALRTNVRGAPIRHPNLARMAN